MIDLLSKKKCLYNKHPVLKIGFSIYNSKSLDCKGIIFFTFCAK